MGFVKSNEGKVYALAGKYMNKRPNELFNMPYLEVLTAAKLQAEVYRMQQPKQTGGKRP